MRHLLLGAILCVVAALAGAGAAGGAFQGGNGMILFDRHSPYNADWSGYSLGAFNPDGSGGGVVLKEGTNSVRPDWSPDGNKFLYKAATPGPEQIVVMNADGSGRTVVYDPPTGESAGGADWSPNGSQIVYSVVGTSAPDKGKPTRSGSSAAGSQLRMMNADGSGKHDVTATNAGLITDVKWSADGIVYSGFCSNGEWGLYLVPVVGGACQLIADSNANGGPQGADIDDNFDVSPDGTKLAYGLNYPTQAVNIWIVDLATNKKQQLTNFPAPPLGSINGVYGGLSWSPDGTKIAFGYNDALTNAFSLAIIDVATGAITKISDPVGSLLTDFHPSWQPCIGGVTKSCSAPFFAAPQTITFGPLPDKTYGDQDFPLTATASSGLPVSYAAFGSCTVSGSVVHLTGVGRCTVTAFQNGSPSFAQATSVQQSFNVGKANQTITFAALPDRTFGDADFAANATASSGLPVSFAASGNCTVSGAVVHLTSAGSCTITASQGGNANYFGAASVSRSFVIASSTSQPPPPTAVSKCVVPHLVGKTLANAKTAIARANCRVGHVGYAYSRARKKGVVLSQARRPGAVLPAKTTIALVVSRGPRP